VPSRSYLSAKTSVVGEVWGWESITEELSGDLEDGMSRRNMQRKHGTTCGPRRITPSEGIGYKPQCGEISMGRQVGRMGSIKR